MRPSFAWSAEAERRLRRRIEGIWLGMWTCFGAGALLLITQVVFLWWICAPMAAACFGSGFFFLLKLSGAREQLGEEMRMLPRGGFYEGSGMLRNKPRSTANLTNWMQHSAREECFYCGCQDAKEIPVASVWAIDGKWIPNFPADEENDGTQIPIDPGGGRFVILCPCGTGHFKLKA